MKRLSTRVKLRNAQKLLKKGQDEEREIIDRLIQDIKGKDISLNQIISKLKEKKTEYQQKTKKINRVIFQIEKQNEKPPENNFQPIESRNQANSKEHGNKKVTEGSSVNTSSQD
jgi:septal ring factor EnvC (AmiA/AmiB activator)